MKRMTNICLVVVIFIFTISGLCYAKVPKYTSLTKYLIDITGWKAEKASGDSQIWPVHSGGPAEERVSVNRIYTEAVSKTAAVRSFAVEISNNRDFWKGVSQSQLNMDDPDAFNAIQAISGHKVSIHYGKAIQECEIYVLLNNKEQSAFLKLTAGGGWTSYHELLDIAKKFPWSGIEKEFDK
jgi:hypothetical protein